jgi:hypothetical protein
MIKMATTLAARTGLALTLLYCATVPASAAVRNCTARLTSVAAQDGTELGAKKKAIDDWLVKAKAAGIEGATWRLAAERRLICQAVAGGGGAAGKAFECIAVGHACAISQNPSKPRETPAAPSPKAPGVDI